MCLAHQSTQSATKPQVSTVLAGNLASSSTPTITQPQTPCHTPNQLTGWSRLGGNTPLNHTCAHSPYTLSLAHRFRQPCSPCTTLTSEPRTAHLALLPKLLLSAPACSWNPGLARERPTDIPLASTFSKFGCRVLLLEHVG